MLWTLPNKCNSWVGFKDRPWLHEQIIILHKDGGDSTIAANKLAGKLLAADLPNKYIVKINGYLYKKD